MNEQGRMYALTAVLAPVRYPVVVGVIAFGLLSPDPVYAPTFQTTPEDRPSALERAGETGLAVAIGAIGIKLGQAGSASELKSGGNLNSNAATSNFGLYEIEVNGELYKIGKADLNRVTQSSGLPTRLRQQLRKIKLIYGTRNAEGRVAEILGQVTTAEAKAAETARIRAFFERTGQVPPGNEKSFRP